MKVIALILAALAGTATAANCGPDKLNTSRTITLKREGAAYGTNQHAALPLAKGEVVLTFDDGPSLENTPAVLKALSDQCAKATFFMIGQNIVQQTELARRVVREGHSTGIHSDTHPHLASLTVEQQLEDLKRSRAAYKTAFGAETPAYRFPSSKRPRPCWTRSSKPTSPSPRSTLASTTGSRKIPPPSSPNA
jgi:peptidoglycan/xylan/chitin deacetylase (PgdA/CDA1 family)